MDGGCTKSHSDECAPVLGSQNRTTSLQQTNETRADGAKEPLICPHGVTYQGNQNGTPSLQQTNETRADGASDSLICPHGVTYQGNQNGTPSLQLMNETRADGRGLYEIA